MVRKARQEGLRDPNLNTANLQALFLPQRTLALAPVDLLCEHPYPSHSQTLALKNFQAQEVGQSQIVVVWVKLVVQYCFVGYSQPQRVVALHQC